MVFFSGMPESARGEDEAGLKERVRQLEGEVRKLREQYGAGGELEADVSEEEDLGTPTVEDNRGVALPKLTLRGFADVIFQGGGNVRTGEDQNAAFSLGEVDLLISSELSDEISVLAEAVFEFEEGHGTEADVERIDMKYSPSDLLNFRIGRMHTPLGYWNQAYHHGTWFQTTIFRPDMYRFEDDNGILPIHSIGLQVFGTQRFDALDLEYNLSFVNGRGETSEIVQNVGDGNDAKAYNLLVSIIPQRLSGLKTGLSGYFDKIPPDASRSDRNGEMTEWILGGYVVYLNGAAEFLAEVSRIRHDDEVSQKNFVTLVYYVQGGYQLGNWKPYYRFDFVNFGAQDPFFAAMAPLDVRRNTVGVRWDAMTWAAVKLEYCFSARDEAADTHKGAAQVAFTF